MLHLNNDAKAARGHPDYDPLFKIRPIIDTLVTKFQDVYTPEEQLTIDEAICPFREHIFFRVYIKGRPHSHTRAVQEKRATTSNIPLLTRIAENNSNDRTAVRPPDHI
jgi:hypothetical protein